MAQQGLVYVRNLEEEKFAHMLAGSLMLGRESILKYVRVAVGGDRGPAANTRSTTNNNSNSYNYNAQSRPNSTPTSASSSGSTSGGEISQPPHTAPIAKRTSTSFTDDKETPKTRARSNTPYVNI